MPYKIVVDKHAEEVLRKWKKSNPINFKKCQRLFLDMAQHPRTGLGHPPNRLSEARIAFIHAE